MPGKKGIGSSGGGLRARIASWESLKGGSPIGTRDYKIQGDTYHKPGSQNPRKGGTGN